MKIAEIKRLVKLVETSGISELEIEEQGSRIKVVKYASGNGLVPAHLGRMEKFMPTAQAGQEATPTTEVMTESAPVENIVKVSSPMVGTFYRAPAPEAPSYIEVGDHVKVGQALCIIEAMKLMNEIEAEVAGIVIRIPVENAEPVEFGQTIFEIRPD
jgi:acetyl-CoA carboxylase biotin carboxyl carrier protein